MCATKVWGLFDVPHQICDFDVKRSGNFEQRANGNFHGAALDRTDEVMVQVGFLRQFFLSQPNFFAMGTDRFTQNSAVIWPR